MPTLAVCQLYRGMHNKSIKMTCVHNNVHAQCLVDIVFVDLPTSIVDLIVAN
jgi:hypothetical protein